MQLVYSLRAFRRAEPSHVVVGILQKWFVIGIVIGTVIGIVILLLLYRLMVVGKILIFENLEVGILPTPPN